MLGGVAVFSMLGGPDHRSSAFVHRLRQSMSDVFCDPIPELLLID